ncbi:MAG TPA: hypothetical protein VHA79_04360, partial [Mycobacteriales bacterium]|nr:hypothetical protein [Mycobacteriales bacterium]
MAPARFPRWIASFGERHGGAPVVAVTGEDVTFTAPDGAVARCLPPFWESRPELPAPADDPHRAASTAAGAVA